MPLGPAAEHCYYGIVVGDKAVIKLGKGATHFTSVIRPVYGRHLTVSYRGGTVLSNSSFRARWDGNRTRIPVYMDTVLSPTVLQGFSFQATMPAVMFCWPQQALSFRKFAPQANTLLGLRWPGPLHGGPFYSCLCFCGGISSMPSSPSGASHGG